MKSAQNSEWCSSFLLLPFTIFSYMPWPDLDSYPFRDIKLKKRKEKKKERKDLIIRFFLLLFFFKLSLKVKTSSSSSSSFSKVHPKKKQIHPLILFRDEN